MPVADSRDTVGDAKGTGLDAVAAADAQVLVNQDEFPLVMGCPCGTDRDTASLRAMKTLHGEEKPLYLIAVLDLVEGDQLPGVS